MADGGYHWPGQARDRRERILGGLGGRVRAFGPVPRLDFEGEAPMLINAGRSTLADSAMLIAGPRLSAVGYLGLDAD